MKTILVDAINTFVSPEKEIFQEMYQLLESYTQPKIILTGANDEQIKAFGLDHMPYEVFTLKHNPEKNDPQYYQTMLKHFNLAPQDTLYFEHNQEAVKSATSAGIHTYHFDKVLKDLVGLKKFIDDNIA